MESTMVSKKENPSIFILLNSDSNHIIGVTSAELDTLAAETCAYMNIIHPDYSKLAARLAVSNLHKYTSPDFLEVAKTLRFLKDA